MLRIHNSEITCSYTRYSESSPFRQKEVKMSHFLVYKGGEFYRPTFHNRFRNRVKPMPPGLSRKRVDSSCTTAIFQTHCEATSFNNTLNDTLLFQNSLADIMQEFNFKSEKHFHWLLNNLPPSEIIGLIELHELKS